MSRKPISSIASDVWAFILGYYEDNAYMPTLTEIGQRFGKSRQWSQYVVRELERSGYIKIIPKKNRGIVIVVK